MRVVNPRGWSYEVVTSRAAPHPKFRRPSLLRNTMSAPQIPQRSRAADWTQLLGSLAALRIVVAATVLTLMLA